jgi:bifunctional DNase/RNase
LRDPERFGAWIHGIARNVVRMWYRRRARTPTLDGGHLLETFADGSQRAPEERLDRQERLARVRQAVQELSSGNRQAVTLRYWGEMSYAEISAALDVPVSTVKSRLHKAKRQLQAELEEKRMAKREKMIPVTVGELYAHELKEGPHAIVEGPHTIVSLDSEDGRSLPIWIGPYEGQALAINRVLSGDELYRPITFDLMAKMLATLGVEVTQVVVSALKDTTFYARLHLTLGDVEHEIDARPSDALNLAVRVGAPVFVAEEVMSAAGKAQPDALPEDIQPFELPEALLKLLSTGPAAQE